MDILNQIYDVAMPILVTGVMGILVKIVVPIGDVAIEYFKEKIQSSGITKQLAQHQDEFNTAKQIWNVIEEKYRLAEKVEDLVVSKKDMFEEILLKKIPYLSKDDVELLNKAIAGEFNKGKQAVITDDTLKQSNIDLQNTNTQLSNQNNDLTNANQVLQNQVNDLQNKLNTINSALSNASQVVQQPVGTQADVNGVTANTTM
jgi:FtsZ-binding cell division protein ZapB